MSTRFRLIFLVLALLSALLTGCGDAGDAASDAGGVSPPVQGEPHMTQLLRLGFAAEDIAAFDDTSYVVQGDMRFTFGDIERVAAQPSFVKAAQDRVAWSECVKNLDQVEGIRVYLTPSGSGAVGPNWAAAVRQAISDWNAISNTAVRFVEVSANPPQDPADVVVTMGATGGAGAITTLVGSPDVDSPILFNSSYEPNNPMTAAAKVSIVKHEFGHVLNFLHSDRLNNGGFDPALVEGTPGPGGDPQSVFTSSWYVGEVRNFTAYDLRAIRSLYPTGAILRRQSNGDLVTEGPTVLLSNVTAFQQLDERILALTTDGTLYRKDGLGGAWVNLGTGVSQFKMVPRFIAAIRSGALYSKTDDGPWVLERSTCHALDLDGNNLASLEYGYLYLKEWKVGTWSCVGSGYRAFRTENGYVYGLIGRVLYRFVGGTTWTQIRTNVSSFKVGSWSQLRVVGSGFVVDTWNRVLVLDADSRLWGSDDAGTIFFPLPVGPVTSYDLSMPTLRVAVRQGSTLQVQKGTLSSSFVTVHTNVSSYQLLNYYVSVITPGGALQSTYGPDGYFLDYTFSGSAGFAQSVSVAP